MLTSSLTLREDKFVHCFGLSGSAILACRLISQNSFTLFLQLTQHALWGETKRGGGRRDSQHALTGTVANWSNDCQDGTEQLY